MTDPKTGNKRQPLPAAEWFDLDRSEKNDTDSVGKRPTDRESRDFQRSCSKNDDETGDKNSPAVYEPDEI